METSIKHRTRFRLTDQTKEWMVYGICLLCLALFASAAYGKIADHETFVKGLSKVSVIGGAAVYLAWFVPIAEIIVCVLLLVPALSKWGLYGFTGLMTVFTGYILSMLFWAKKLPCHCNLIIEKLSWGQHLWFNVGFIALAVLALWLGKAKQTLNK
ncbi:MauE/DoxX family redox-associated membrane protein [Pedobacter sp. ASV1-7]|uniref:MauE/DoxX family redox-associated membrane protein n=1 Tax=Pedobacter sp. ASV1-7 TaxID=3145237 RepID=UPI0032E90393